MEPIKDPVPGKFYFGYECRCGKVILLAEGPEQGPSPFTGTEPMPVTCSSCGLVSSVPPVKWQRFRAL
jgi:hypothetical protein